jgi:hypothetical protein
MCYARRVDGSAVHAVIRDWDLIAHAHEAQDRSARVLDDAIGAYHRVGSTYAAAALPGMVQLPTLRNERAAGAFILWRTGSCRS